ncbi:unnamed protein product [Lactuca virosa]|uniref:GTD-binding domain-containing protein n=1 Tax=Lactuca virosa TaxID=75947 RepID=A0AAU9M7I6_9ASTR|nr:unnamed protein product [Lactuca virosa]
MALSKRSFKNFVVEELGEFPHFLLWAILEWILIASLYIDGLLAFLSSVFAKIFDLEPPCVLCTRVDHALVCKDPNTYYNDSICECHKKDISSLAYCHIHRKLADIKNMCEGCSFAFATEKESDIQSLLGRMQKEKDGFTEDDKKVLKPVNRCSCCGEPLKMRAASKDYTRSLSNLRASTAWKTEDSRYTELRFLSDTEPDMREYDFGLSTYAKYDELHEDCCRTPNLLKSNKLFGIPLTDSGSVSPRRANRISRKASMEKYDLASDNDEASGDGDSSLQQIKKQARIDQKTLMKLSMELDEERSAAAIAANNAMAMITRLQAEKASVQMEALQYQRMMEEHVEYDKEAIQILKDLLAKRDEHLKVMESELQSYREKYGEIRKVGSDQCEADADEYYQEWRSQSLSSFSEKSESRSPLKDDHDHEFESPLVKDDDDDFESWSPLGTDGKDGDQSHSGRGTSSLDFETEKYQLYEMLKNLENHIQTSSMEDEWDDDEDKDIVKENRATLNREITVIRERLRALEADSGFLKHTAMTLQKGEKGAELLTEIAQHLRKLRTYDIFWKEKQPKEPDTSCGELSNLNLVLLGSWMNDLAQEWEAAVGGQRSMMTIVGSRW